MTRQDAINWALSKKGQYMNYDNQFGTQCVDFFNYYYEYVTGFKPYSQGLGVDFARQLAEKRPGGVTWVQNNPADKNQLPSDGDIVVLKGFTDNMGHVGVSYGTNASRVHLIDQTPGGSVATRTWDWTNVLGWFVPNAFNQTPNPTPQGSDEMIKNQDEARLAYRLLRGDVPVSQEELNLTAGKRSWLDFATGATNELIDREKNRKALEARVKELESQPPKVVEKEVIKEVTKEVVKEVPVRVEVPIEVPVEVPVQTPVTWASVVNFLRDQIRTWLKVK